MKKLLLIAAVVVGGVAASQAGVRVNIGIGLPHPPHVVIGHPAPVYEPVYAPACPPPVVIRPPVYCPPPVVYHRPHHGHWRQHRHGHHHGHYRHHDRHHYSYNQRGGGHGRGSYGY